MGARYNRVLTRDSIVAALKPEGPLDFLIRDLPNPDRDSYALDIQLREHDQVMYYHGTTRLLNLTFFAHEHGVTFSPDAARAYAAAPKCTGAFGELSTLGTNDPVQAESAFGNYLQAAISVAGSRYYANKREGYWQNRLCIRYGPNSQADDDWLIIDRECVITFHDTQEKVDFYEPLVERYERIRDGLQERSPRRWGTPRATRERLGDELDILAVNREGDLLAIELKHGTNTKGIYWGPLQVGVYRDAFQAKIAELSPGVRRLVEQKTDLGLLPSHARKRLPDGNFINVIPVLAIADPPPSKECWAMLGEVMTKAGRIEVSGVRSASGGFEVLPDYRPPVAF